LVISTFNATTSNKLCSVPLNHDFEKQLNFWVILMKPDLYWIPNIPYGRLAIMPRPRSGDWLEDEIKAWKNAGIDMVVSLLTALEVMELGLQNESELCVALGIHYIVYPIPDRQVPTSMPSALALIKDIDAQLKAGKAVAIHCRAGIGRSSLLAACTLGTQGLAPHVAFGMISKARGVQVPDTDEQRHWVEDFLTHLKQ
jgi:protein-tyrosine phosphatase